MTWQDMLKRLKKIARVKKKAKWLTILSMQKLRVLKSLQRIQLQSLRIVDYQSHYKLRKKDFSNRKLRLIKSTRYHWGHKIVFDTINKYQKKRNRKNQILWKVKVIPILIQRLAKKNQIAMIARRIQKRQELKKSLVKTLRFSKELVMIINAHPVNNWRKQKPLMRIKSSSM